MVSRNNKQYTIIWLEVLLFYVRTSRTELGINYPKQVIRGKTAVDFTTQQEQNRDLKSKQKPKAFSIIKQD